MTRMRMPVPSKMILAISLNTARSSADLEATRFQLTPITEAMSKTKKRQMKNKKMTMAEQQ